MMNANRSSDRVRALAAEGKLDAAEAARLLAAIDAPAAGASQWNKVLLNPFARLQTSTALVLGGITAACGVGAAIALGVRFDGFVDLHVVSNVTLRAALLDQLASVLIPAFVLFTCARLLSPALRVVDFVVVTTLARAPLTLMSAPIALVSPAIVPGAVPTASLRLLAMIAFALLGVVGHVTWLFNGFRTASGVTGARSTAAFIGALVAAEVISKIALRLFAL